MHTLEQTQRLRCAKGLQFAFEISGSALQGASDRLWPLEQVPALERSSYDRAEPRKELGGPIDSGATVYGMVREIVLD